MLKILHLLIQSILTMADNINIRDLFLLNPKVTFLNFGSFGATPKPIFDQYTNFQLALERDPVQFLTKHVPLYLKNSREALSRFINCNLDDIVMVTNPTYAVNTIGKSLNLIPGDEILTTKLEYGACDRTWDYICERAKARYIQQPIKLPLTTEEEFVDELFSGVTLRTKLIFISHITSATALILPVEKVIQKAKTLGIPVFIDGAHAPGHINLDLSQLDPDYYTGACHKWLMTPKGSSFMYVKRIHQPNIYPLVVSWGYKADKPSHSQFLDWHEMSGTRDYAALMCIPEAIRFHQEHNWSEVAGQCRKVVHNNAITFTELLNSELLCPLDEKFISQMLSVPIRTDNPDLLYHTLVHEYKIEIPVMQHNGIYHMRYSINGFNTQADMDKLFDAISQIKKTGLLY